MSKNFLTFFNLFCFFTLIAFTCKAEEKKVVENTKFISSCSSWQSQLTEYKDILYTSDKPEEIISKTSFYSSEDGIQASTTHKDMKISCAYFLPEYDSFLPNYKLTISQCSKIKKEECEGVEVLDYYALEVFFRTFILSKVFPEGPTIATKEKVTRSLEEKEKPGSIEFRGTTLSIKPPWTAKVTIQKIDANIISFEIDYDSDGKKPSSIYKGTWSNKPLSELPAFKDDLSKWKINTEINKNILNQNPKTVGDLRELILKENIQRKTK
ncbi:MAG: hypothetical protein SFU25_06145 [Candidatus Caenarcaniphilales bacterium]|nr:hypothetical protein [Candidatus Caenarcaniphilales bacterium]